MWVEGAVGPGGVARGVHRLTDLTGSVLCWNQFRHVDFTGSDLSRADLRRSTFEGCTFAGARLRGALLTASQRDHLGDADLHEVAWHDEDDEPPGG